MENNVIDRRKSVPAAASAPAGEAGASAPGGMKPAEVFEKAIALFHAGKFEVARGLFAQVGEGDTGDLARAARLHARMCERRLPRTEPALKSAEDRYNYAIALINERRVEAAERHLKEAVAETPEGDHIYYALALCRGLSGDLDGAYRHLKKALDLQPRNRALARNDPDFADIGQRPPIRELLYPERHSS